MLSIKKASGSDTEILVAQIEAVRTGVWFTDLANISALLSESLSDINWVGFYLYHQGKLWLGPFQGRAACTYIEMGRGVCGKSAAEKQTLIVADVHAFSDHIVCDSRSRSEIVVPLLHEGRLLGVLDVDSPLLNRFHEGDAKLLEQIAALVSESLRDSPFYPILKNI